MRVDRGAPTGRPPTSAMPRQALHARWDRREEERRGERDEDGEAVTESPRGGKQSAPPLQGLHPLPASIHYVPHSFARVHTVSTVGSEVVSAACTQAAGRGPRAVGQPVAVVATVGVNGAVAPCMRRGSTRTSGGTTKTPNKTTRSKTRALMRVGGGRERGRRGARYQKTTTGKMNERAKAQNNHHLR